ncbi:MAG: nicotinamide riboside transporter PnuC [Flavobacteriaceae bacterium]|nr:nicotinamide riboside transporter PnuC [Flavobacteriaceae bacterium]
MNEIIDFFSEPYRTAPTYLIILEFIAMVFGIISVIYAKKENKLVFPTGFISTSIYIYILYYWEIYGDLTINIYYTIMSVYGWYMWNKLINNKEEHIPISRTNKKEKIIAFGIFIVASFFVIFIYRTNNVMPNHFDFIESVNFAVQNLTSGNLEKFRIAVPFIDTFTTATAFVAMWLMTQKKIENWTFWIATNILSIPLYFVKGLGFTGIQYAVFLVLAFQGYKQWKKILDKKAQTS